MTIPTYQIINDNEIDPESPITSSLMTRLRNNCLALLGVDTTDASPRAVTSASVLSQFASGVFYGKDNTPSPEVIIGKLTSKSELTTIVPMALSGFGATDYDIYMSVVYSAPVSGSMDVKYRVCDIHVNYTSGTPTSVTVTVLCISSYGNSVTAAPYNNASAGGSLSFTVPIDNAWHNQVAVGNPWYGVVATYLAFKARADSTYVYLQVSMPDGGSPAGPNNGLFSFGTSSKELIVK